MAAAPTLPYDGEGPGATPEPPPTAERETTSSGPLDGAEPGERAVGDATSSGPVDGAEPGESPVTGGGAADHGSEVAGGGSGAAGEGERSAVEVSSGGGDSGAGERAAEPVVANGESDGAVRGADRPDGDGAEAGQEQPAASAPAARHGGGSGGGGANEADRAITGALRTIVVPDHDSQFWDDLAAQLADEPQLRLRPRAAVRPITQPPPVIDDRLPFDEGDLRPRGRSRRKRRRRAVVWVVAIILSALVIAAALENGDDSGDDVQAGDTTTTAPTGGGTEGSTASTAPPAAIDPAAPLTPGGVGPLTVGTALRDLQAAGAPAIVVDQPTFTGTGGTCFDATVTGVPDLVLRFRSPEPGVGITDPADGVLAAVGVDAQLGSQRATEAGIALGATEDQVRAAYPEDLSEADYDYVPGGHVFTFDAPDTDNGIAFMTDGATVISIVVGASDVIGYPEGCPA